MSHLEPVNAVKIIKITKAATLYKEDYQLFRATIQVYRECVFNPKKILGGVSLEAMHFPPKDLNRDANWQTVKDLEWVAPRCEYMHWY